MRNRAEDLLFWIALGTAANVGSRRFIALVKHFGSPQKALEASQKELSQVEDVGQITASSIKNKINWKEAKNR